MCHKGTRQEVVSSLPDGEPNRSSFVLWACQMPGDCSLTTKPCLGLHLLNKSLLVEINVTLLWKQIKGQQQERVDLILALVPLEVLT